MLIVQDRPFSPAASPDHQILATTKVDEGFVTPEGANYKLLLNGHLVYPGKRKHVWFHAYEDQHTFLSDLTWSPDSQHLAFAEKVYDWEYLDPYNRYFDGTVSKESFYLVIVARDGTVRGYQLLGVPGRDDPRWQDSHTVVLNQRPFDLQTNAPTPIR
jgi:hypothetical protein